VGSFLEIVYINELTIQSVSGNTLESALTQNMVET
jgi:hypothetical protein